MTDSRWVDPEIDDIFAGEPELAALAHRVREARPEPPLDPRFSSVLRAHLMREAAAMHPAPTRVPRRWRLPSLAWSGAGVGVALIAAAALLIANTHVQDHTVTAMSPVAERHAVSPDNVITVAFSQPMDERAVVAGLRIEPATQVTTSWQGNNLLISPTHHLAGNTPYTVTIDRTAARAADGQLAPAAITISFGTAPTPPVAATVWTLVPHPLGVVDTGAQLVAGPGGTVIATSAPPPAAAPGAGNPAPTATPAVSPAPTSTPSPSPSPSPAPSPSPSPSPSDSAGSPAPAGSPGATAAPVTSGSSVVDFGPGGGRVVLGPAATSAAISPDGLQLLSAITAGAATQITLSSTSGTQHTVLSTIAAPVLATGWLAPDRALVAEPDRVISIDLQGHVSTLSTLPAGTSSVVFAPVGGATFAGATGHDGQLITLSSGQVRPLPGSRTMVAFSGDGHTVAWIDSTGAVSRLVTSPVDREAAAIVPLSHPGDTLSDLALDQAGGRVAVVDHASNGAAELDVDALPSGSVIARGPAAAHPLFLRDGDLALLTGDGHVAEATLSSGAGSGSGLATMLPDGTASTLQAFVDAQTAADASALAALAAPSVAAAALTPHGLTRSYVISAVTNADGTVTATARLIVDASTAHPLASFADERLTLAPGAAGSPYQVTALTVGPLTDEPVGPHVLHVVAAVAAERLALQVSFDSDLTAATVAAAIQVTTHDGQVLAATTTYDPESRTATVSLDVPGDTAVIVTVATSLLDVDGQHLAQAFSAGVGG